MTSNPTDEASPRPWEYLPPTPYDGDDEEFDGGFMDPGYITDANGDAVCAFGDAGGSGHLYENPGNPLLIVRAVNAYDDALTALWEVKVQAQTKYGSAYCDEPAVSINLPRNTIRLIDAAIAKMEGRT